MHAVVRTIDLNFVPQRQGVGLFGDESALFFGYQFGVFVRVGFGALGLEDLDQVFICVEEHGAFSHPIGGTEATVNKLARPEDLYRVVSVGGGQERVICGTVDQCDAYFSPLLFDNFKRRADDHRIVRGSDRDFQTLTVFFADPVASDFPTGLIKEFIGPLRVVLQLVRQIYETRGSTVENRGGNFVAIG